MIYQTIGRNMKRFRQENHMMQSELANLLFVSPQMISRYENNSAVPDIRRVYRELFILRSMTSYQNSPVRK